MSNSWSVRVLRAILITAIAAPGTGCALINKLLGKKDAAQTQAERKPPSDINEALPEAAFTEAQWAEQTAAAAAMLAEKTVQQQLHLVGTYPHAEPAEVTVKGGHCHELALAWAQTSYPTLVVATYGRTAADEPVSAAADTEEKFLDHGETMLICADKDGPITLVVTRLSMKRKYKEHNKRTDKVQWAAVVSERPETEEQRAARFMRGWKDKLQERFGSEAKEFGRAVAERCNDCRWQYAGCMKERKDEDPKAAHDACFLRFESCAAPAGLNRAGGLACHSPPLWNLR